MRTPSTRPGASSPAARWSHALLWETEPPSSAPLWLPHSPAAQSLILNSVGCVVTEAPEDLKSALRMVSGSTSAGGLDEVAEFTLRGSSLSFFTEGLSLSRLWGAGKPNPCQFSRSGRDPLFTKHLLPVRR